MRADSENSVMRALKDLSRMETERAAEEREKAALARAEERRRQEAAQRLEAQAVMERERRRKLEEELRRKDGEARLRILSLRAELDAVQADRQAMRQAMISRYESLPPSPSRGTGARMVPLNRVITGFVVLIAAVVGAFQLIPPSPENPPLGTASDDIVQRVPGAPEAAEAPESPREPGIETTALVEEAAVVAPPQYRAKARSGPRDKKGQKRGPKHPPKTKPRPEGKDIIDDFGACGNDPMCGFAPSPRDEKKRP
jgi:hypothetical protein